MKVLVCDIECTTSNKGNPHDTTNELCYVGLFDGENYQLLDIEYSDNEYGSKLKKCQELLDTCDLIIGFNLKFDLAWLRKYNLKYENKKIWDGQVVHFILQGQTTAYPSLNSVAEYYGLESKLDVISETYWKNGIDTKEIPQHLLEEYLQQDLKVTYLVYLKQLEEVRKKSLPFQRLVSLTNQDLMVLHNIESNGFYFNEDSCKQKAEELSKQINELRMKLHDYHNIEEFNTESGDHLSCLIYGGTITIPRKEIVGTYKTGDRKGEDKYGWKDYSYTLPRLFNPLPKSELKKPGYWATGEDILRQLKSRDKFSKRVIEIILTLAKLEKMVNGYYNGLPKLRETMNWQPNMLHGQLNMCMATTGRLSSSRPNLQNLAGDAKIIFETRFK